MNIVTNMGKFTATEIEGGEGDQFDLFGNAGQWLGWVSRLGEDDGQLTLMSTGAPLGHEERCHLAIKASAAIGERVSPE